MSNSESSLTPSGLIHTSRIPNRWIQLVAGIIAMMAIANLQYAWTLFTKPIQAHLHASLVAVQWTFTLFVLLETWLVPFEGYWWIWIGPRLMLGLGSIMVGLGWIGSGRAETINSLYFWYGVGGIGAGVVYGGAIGNALKWFPDHRGLCVGLTAGAFGIGTATTIAPIANMLKFRVISTRLSSGDLFRAWWCWLVPSSWQSRRWDGRRRTGRRKKPRSKPKLTPRRWK